MSRVGIKNLVEFVEDFASVKSGNLLEKNWKHVVNIFDVNVSKGEMYIPETFYPKIQKWFGKLDDKHSEDAVLRVESQTIVRIVNKWTFAQTLFNPLRASRPMNNNLENKSHTEISDILQQIPDKCDFCSPLSYTGVDTWGRIERDTCMTASNCAKYDGKHGLIIFKTHSPLDYSKEKLVDIFGICDEWFKCAHEENNNAIYPMLTWNCKGKAGASQSHGHAHLLLGESFHYGKWEYLRNCAKLYNLANPQQNYFEDLIRASRALGLIKTIGAAHIIVNLTPTFGYDLMVIGWHFDRDFRDALDSAIKTLLYRYKSLTFNIGIHFPPLHEGEIRPRLNFAKFKEDMTTADAPMPFIAYLVDRGEHSNGKFTSDFCGMMLNGSNIVSNDPFESADVMRVPDMLWK